MNATLLAVLASLPLLQGPSPITATARGWAAVVSARAGKNLEQALPALMAARHANDPRLRAAARDAWSKIGPGLRAALPFVRQALRQPNDPQARQRASLELSKHGLAAVPALFDAIEAEPTDPNDYNRYRRPNQPGGSYYSTVPVLGPVAAEALGRLGPSVVPTLTAALAEPHPGLRNAAAQALGRIGSAAASAVPALAAALNDRDLQVRATVATSLGQLAATVPAARMALIGVVGHRDANVRRSAINTLAGNSVVRYPSYTRYGYAAPQPVAMPGPNPGMIGPNRPASPRLTADARAALAVALDDPDFNNRLTAASALANAQPQDPAALTVLVEELGARESFARQQAEQALERLGPRARPVAATLRRLLTEATPTVRAEAARVLFRMGPEEAAAAKPVLQALLGDEDAAVRVQAATAFWDHGDARTALPVLLEALGSADQRAVQSARTALYRTVLSADTVPILSEALRNGNAQARVALLDLLGRMGESARAAMPAVAELLRDPDRNVRQRALFALQRAGRPPKELAPKLVALLAGPDRQVQSQALYLLQQMGADAKEAAPALVKLLANPDFNLRTQALRILATFGPDELRPAVPALTKLLKDPQMGTRTEAARALGEAGPAAKSAIPALQVVLKDAKTSYVSLTVLRALIQIQRDQPGEVVPAVLTLLSNTDAATAVQVGSLLAQSGPVAHAALPALAELTKDKRPEVRRRAAQLLHRLDPFGDDPTTRAALMAVLRGTDPAARLAAAQVLKSASGADVAAVRTVFIELLDAPDSQVRAQAIAALREFGSSGDAAAVRPALRRALKRDDNSTRLSAAQALLALDPSAADRAAAVAALTGLLPSTDPQMRLQAASTLRSHEPKADAAAVPVLLALLKDRNFAISSQAAAALGMRPIAPAVRRDAAKIVVELLRDRSSPFRNQIESVLPLLGPEGAEIARPVLLEMLQQPNERSFALRLMQRYGPTELRLFAPDLRRLLDTAGPASLAEIANMLTRLGGADAAAARKALTTLAANESDPNRWNALVALQHSGPAGSAAARPLLLAELKRPDPEARYRAAQVLLQAPGGRPPAEAVAVVTADLQDPNPSKRMRAANTMIAAGLPETDAAVPVLFALLDNPTLRPSAATALVRARPDHPRLVPALVAIVKSGPFNERTNAIELLGQLGPRAQAAVPLLAELLHDPRTSYSAARALAQIGPAGLPPLLEAARAGRLPQYQINSIWSSLPQLGPDALPAVPQLMTMLEKGSPLFRQQVQTTILHSGPEAVPAVAKALESSSLTTRRLAFTILNNFGPAARLAVPALRHLLADDDPALRRYAATLLWQLGDQSPAAVAILKDALTATDPTTRRQAVGVLHSGPVPTDLVPPLKELRSGPDPVCRAMAAAALLRVPGEEKAAVEVLIAALADRRTRFLSESALAAAGPAAKAALPALRELLLARPSATYVPNDTPSAFVRIGGVATVEEVVRLVALAMGPNRTRLIRVLAQVGPVAGPALRKFAKDPAPAIRAAAVTALGTLAREHADFVGPIVAALKDPERTVRQAAVTELRSLGPVAAPARPALVGLLADAFPHDRIEIVLTLAAIGGDPQPALDVLRAALGQRALQVPRSVLIQALGQFGQAAAPVVPALTAALYEEYANRCAALDTLAHIGPAAKSAVPALRKFLTAPDLTTRTLAAIALWRIEGKADAVAPVLIAAVQNPAIRYFGRSNPIPNPDGPRPALMAWQEQSPRLVVPLLKALGEIGPAAKPAAVAVRELQKDEDPGVRKAAAAALRNIGA